MNKNSNIHIVGLSGAEGTAIAHFLVKEGYSNITAHDFCEKELFVKNFRKFHTELNPNNFLKLLRETQELDIKFKFKKEYLEGVLEADLIFVPQSWYLYDQNKIIFEAQKKGIELKTMMQLYLELAPCITIGITGSNGKSTTSKLIHHILKSFNNRTFLAGNDRKNIQILDQIRDFKETDFLVLEISNRQLKMPLLKSPHISLITNITPNHLNEHKDFEDYIETKTNIFSKQTKNDYLVLNAKDKVSQEIKLDNIKSEVVLFENLDDFDFSKTGLKGPHNRENIMAAVTVAKLLNVPESIIQGSVDAFQALDKRLSVINISKLEKKIKFVNDLSSTTPESTIKALESFEEGNIILFLGGENKNLKLDKLAETINKKKPRVFYSKGTVSKNLIPALNNDIIVSEFLNIEKVLKVAYETAKSKSVILFSPAGEGFISSVLDNKSLKYWINRSLS